MNKESIRISFSNHWQRYWLTAFFYLMGIKIADGVFHALVLAQKGAGILPNLFIAKAIAIAILSAIYVPLSQRISNRYLLKGIIAISVGSYGICYILFRLKITWAYIVLYLITESLLTLFKIHWGSLLLSSFEPNRLESDLARTYSAAPASSIVAGLFLTLAKFIKTTHLIPITILSILFSFFLSIRLNIKTPNSTLRDDTQKKRPTIKVLTQERFLYAIIVSTTLLVFCRYSLRYLYSDALAKTLTEKDIALYFGSFLVIANLFTTIAQRFFTPFLLRSWGIKKINLVYALSLFITSWLQYFRLEKKLLLATLARFIETELKNIIKTPLSNLFYQGLYPQNRSAGRAIVLGLFVPFTTIASGVIIKYNTHHEILGLALIAVLFLIATIVQNYLYENRNDSCSNTKD